MQPINRKEEVKMQKILKAGLGLLVVLILAYGLWFMLDSSEAKAFTAGMTFRAPTYFYNTLTIGQNTTGYDVKFYGATTEKYLLWDESADTLNLTTANLVLPVKTTAGDPASPTEGQIYVNSFDNKVKVYADGAWRDLTTW